MESFEDFKRKIRRIPRRGSPEGAHTVDLAEIVKLLNNESLEDVDFAELVKLLNNESLESLEEFNKGFEENIFIDNTDKHRSKHIKIENMRLSLNKADFLSLRCPSPIAIVFENNTFLYEGEGGKLKRLNINLSANGTIEFNHNELKNVELYFETPIDQTAGKHIKFKNNEIFAIKCPVHARVDFQRYNIINRLDIVLTEEDQKKDIDDRFGVRWTPYQIIDLNKKHFNVNKASFIVLKERAVRKGDKLQESVIQREILKCESILFESKNDNALRQDRWIMSFGKWISGHGVFWLRPFFCLLGVNIFFTFVAFLITWEFPFVINFLDILVEMFNPISSLNSTMKFADADDNVAISAINIFQKIVFALLTYELIRVMRRFT